MLQMLTSVIDNIFYMYNSNISLKDSCKHYAQIINRIGPIRQHQAGHQRPVVIYQIQAEGTFGQVVQALLMEYCKMKKPLHWGFLLNYKTALPMMWQSTLK